MDFKKLRIGQTVEVTALNQEYFEKYGGNRGYNESYRYCGFDWPLFKNWFRLTNLIPNRILDLGCSTGLTVRDMRRDGFDAHGIEIADYAFTIMPESIKPFCRQLDMRDIPKLKYLGYNDWDCLITNSLMYLTEEELKEVLPEMINGAKQSLIVINPYSDRPDSIPEDAERKLLKPRQWWIDTFEATGKLKYVPHTELMFKVVKGIDQKETKRILSKMNSNL